MKLIPFFLISVLTWLQDYSVVGSYQIIHPEKNDILWIKSDGDFIYQDMGKEYLKWVERSGTWITVSDTLILQENRIVHKFYKETDNLKIVTDTLMIEHKFIISKNNLKAYSTDLFDKTVFFDKKQ